MARATRRSTGADSFLAGWKTGPGTPDLEPELHLAAVDPKLGELIERVVKQSGPRRFLPSNAHSHFDALARSIVYQQLSGKAAATIYGRFSALFPRKLPSAKKLLTIPTESLRAAGLSGGKTRFLQALASHVEEGSLDLAHVAALSNEEILDALTAVPGIGEWTAQMFLMFRLQRPDVLPTGDLGVRKGLQIAHRLRKLPAPKYLERVGKKWAPHRSIASLYLWSAVDLVLPA